MYLSGKKPFSSRLWCPIRALTRDDLTVWLRSRGYKVGRRSFSVTVSVPWKPYIGVHVRTLGKRISVLPTVLSLWAILVLIATFGIAWLVWRDASNDLAERVIEDFNRDFKGLEKS